MATNEEISQSWL